MFCLPIITEMYKPKGKGGTEVTTPLRVEGFIPIQVQKPSHNLNIKYDKVNVTAGVSYFSSLIQLSPHVSVTTMPLSNVKISINKVIIFVFAPSSLIATQRIALLFFTGQIFFGIFR